ncbi:MAG: PQQ-like beta-propeller repeat protein, partial [Planctomycetales bacterium]|nr:PQQ-like beta-propeller repeat protein [Planctomycetales bacterium]
MEKSKNGPSLNRRKAMAAGVSASLMVPASCAAAQQSRSQDWWGWRGPTFNNHAAADAKLPSSITPQAVAWEVSIPGRGHSTPVVVGDSIFLTTADKAAGTQSVLAIGREGKGLWGKVIHSGGIPTENHPNNTEASPTLAYDGEALFASFYNSDRIQLTKLTIDGNILWQKEAGRYSPNQYKYGYAASPLIYRNLVIVNADFDGAAFLAALNRESGEIVWKVARPGKISFSSPIVANLAGRDQLLLSGGEMVAAYDPSNGNILWKVDGATTMATCGTMVWDGDLVFASGGYPESETVCIKADGSGKLLWSNRTKCYEQSMVARDGFLYAVADSGVAYCWRGSDGNTMWRQRIGGQFSSSPLLIGDTIVVFSEDGNGFAFAASPQGFKGLGQAKIADEVLS